MQWSQCSGPSAAVPVQRSQCSGPSAAVPVQRSQTSPDVKHANVCMKFGTHRSQLDSPTMHEHTNPQSHDQ